MRLFSKNVFQSQKSVIFLIIGTFSLLFITIYLILPVGFEWTNVFRPAALRFIAGANPYLDPAYLNSPWLLVFILPFAILPEHAGFALYTLAGLLAITWIAYRFKVKPLFLIPILFSYPITLCLVRGQVDWLALVGAVLPPQLGLFLVLSKPQIGLGIAVFWAIEAFRSGGLRRLVITFGPVTLLTLLSILPYGLWFVPPAGIQNSYLNVSFWPESIPIGLALLTYSIRKSRINFSIIASPFFSPYLSAYSWSGVLLGLAAYPAELTAVSIGIWIWRILQLMG
jgi:hypothetical protein